MSGRRKGQSLVARENMRRKAARCACRSQSGSWLALASCWHLPSRSARNKSRRALKKRREVARRKENNLRRRMLSALLALLAAACAKMWRGGGRQRVAS